MKRHLPVIRNPPSTGVASYGEPGGPQATIPAGLPKISWALFGSGYALVVEQPCLWHTTHPVDPSTLAIASVTWAKIEGFSSMPPTDFAFSMVKNPPSIRALTTGLVRFRISSFSSAAAAIKGMRSRAFWTCGWTVGMVCLLLRETAVPIDYQRAGRPGQAMATQGDGSAWKSGVDRPRRFMGSPRLPPIWVGRRRRMPELSTAGVRSS